MVWKFISAFYESRWDFLIANNNNTSFRSKVSVKFTSKINRVNINNNKNKSRKSPDLLATFNKLLPFIPAKLPKEVNEISKYFKKNYQFGKKNKIKKLYTQASTSANFTKKVLKIKETFPNLLSKKIENIQKIISDEDKIKPKLHMTMKELF